MSVSKQAPVKSAENAFAITRTMRVSDILAVLPDCSPLLSEYGLQCVGCHFNSLENLEDGCRSHGFADEDIDDLVSDLNILLSEKPSRPQTLAMTAAAAVQLKQILAADGKEGWGLNVGLDEQGGFCLEAAKEAEEGEKTFLESHHEGVALFANELTLRGIGGSTIDFREGRFKLDLPEGVAGCSCANGGGCNCKN